MSLSYEHESHVQTGYAWRVGSGEAATAGAPASYNITERYAGILTVNLGSLWKSSGDDRYDVTVYIREHFMQFFAQRLNSVRDRLAFRYYNIMVSYSPPPKI